MQRIARENGLSETAFLVGEGARYDLRWFTPAVERKPLGELVFGARWDETFPWED